MKKYLAVFLLLIITSGLSAQAYYHKKNGKIYYRNKVIEGADSDKLILFGDSFYERVYAHDGKNVYCEGEIIEGADSETFRRLKTSYMHGGPDDYWADKNTIYFRGEPLSGSNPEEYRESFGYFLTGGKVFLGSRELEMFDGDTFSIIEIQHRIRTSNSFDYGYLIEDKNGIYINEQKLDSIDKRSFRPIDEHIFKDKNGVYKYYAVDNVNSVERLNLHPDSLKIERYSVDCNLSVLLLTDGKHTYLSRRDRGEVPHSINLKTADGASLKVYAKHKCGMILYDKSHFYYLGMYSSDLNQLPVINKDVRLVYYDRDRSIIVMADANGVYEIQGSAYERKEDPKTVVFIKANEVLYKKGFGAAVYMDRHNINGNIQRAIQDGEYEELLHYARPSSYYDSLRLKDLGKDSLKEDRSEMPDTNAIFK